MAEPAPYDSIVSAYDAVTDPTKMPGTAFGEYNFREHVQQHIQGKAVLDLACGTGHYSRLLLEWGARSVVGVDISHGMIEHARAAAQQGPYGEDVLQFCVGDAAAGMTYFDPRREEEREGFSVVVGGWLLNYAPNTKVLTEMWQTIANNLRPGGVFIGITTPPVWGSRNDLDQLLKSQWPRLGLTGHVIQEVSDGQGFEVHNILGIDDMERAIFTNYWLRPHCYTSSARSVGAFERDIEWLPLALPIDHGRPGFVWEERDLEYPELAIVRAIKSS